jgi:hypothetical protein
MSSTDENVRAVVRANEKMIRKMLRFKMMEPKRG